ncbi:hypothetical protein PybrP1_011671 [[Pythium] brassicae (nom. inval.)]|nr:hypothetical protein PybrP1_011671 [[Pythium] brassicae (nom. inval.)]
MTTAATPSAPIGGSLSVETNLCPPPSSGDLKNGISVIGDSRCLTKSVVGCMPNLACRFCAKTVMSTSSHLESCDVPVCPLPSPGDVASGLDIFVDKRCAGGGIGCRDTQCRFCITKPTLSGPFKNYVVCSTIP